MTSSHETRTTLAHLCLQFLCVLLDCHINDEELFARLKNSPQIQAVFNFYAAQSGHINITEGDEDQEYRPPSPLTYPSFPRAQQRLQCGEIFMNSNLRAFANIREPALVAYYYAGLGRQLRHDFHHNEQTEILPNAQIRIDYLGEVLLVFWRFMESNSALVEYIFAEEARCLQLTEVLLYYLNLTFRDMYQKPYYLLIVIFSKFSASKVLATAVVTLFVDKRFPMFLNKHYPNSRVFVELPLFDGTYMDLLINVLVCGVLHCELT